MEGGGIFLMNKSQSILSCLVFREGSSINNSSSAENAIPTKMRIFTVITPAMISRRTISQNGTLIMAPHAIPLHVIGLALWLIIGGSLLIILYNYI